MSEKYASSRSTPDDEVTNDIKSVVKRLLPTNIYYCLSGQITIWIISIFGTTESLAQLGALGRISVLINVITLFFGTLIIPRFAKLPKSGSLIKTRFLQIQLILYFLGTLITGITFLIPNFILAILGPNYQNLHGELILTVMAACMGMISTVTAQLANSRKIIISPFIFIPLAITLQTVLIYMIKPTDLSDVIIYGGLVTLGIYLMRITHLSVTKGLKA